MKKRIQVALLSFGLFLQCSAMNAYAYTEVSVDNEFTTGIVDIELNEYTIEDGKEVLWKNDVKNILPGQDIYKNPRITNCGNDCYVRVNIQMINTPLTMEALYGMPEEWVLAPDGYFYYRDILYSGESVDLFKGFSVPEDLSEDTAESVFEIYIDVDAIQSDNFTPNYNLDSPWGYVEILDCEKEGMYDITTLKKVHNLKFKITYENETGKLVKNEEDFFENFPALLPGDVYKDSLQFMNNSTETVNLYFRTESETGTKLLDNIYLKIIRSFQGEERVLYEGTVRASELRENTLLAVVKGGESGNIVYEIRVPDELDNEYAIMEDSVRWVFSTDFVDNKDAVQTGDRTLYNCLSLMAVSVLMLSWLRLSVICGKGGKKDGK